MHPEMPGPSERECLFSREVMFGDIYPEWVKVQPSFPPRLKARHFSCGLLEAGIYLVSMAVTGPGPQVALRKSPLDE